MTITDSSGNACYVATYTPYGQEMATTNTCPQNYKYTGYEQDAETGLYYAFARYYSARLGRFLSPDPLGGSTADPQSLNRYAYVGNDATDLIDPSGMQPPGWREDNVVTFYLRNNFGGNWDVFDLVDRMFSGQFGHYEKRLVQDTQIIVNKDFSITRVDLGSEFQTYWVTQVWGAELVGAFPVLSSGPGGAGPAGNGGGAGGGGGAAVAAAARNRIKQYNDCLSSAIRTNYLRSLVLGLWDLTHGEGLGGLGFVVAGSTEISVGVTPTPDAPISAPLRGYLVTTGLVKVSAGAYLIRQGQVNAAGESAQQLSRDEATCSGILK